MSKSRFSRAWRYRCETKSARIQRKFLKATRARGERRAVRLWVKSGSTQAIPEPKLVLNDWDVI